MLTQAGQDNIVYGYFPAKRWLCSVGQNCTSNFLVQFCLSRIWTTLNRLWANILRSSRLEMFFKIGVLKNFAMFTGNHLCWNFFLIKLQPWRPATLLKRDSNTGAFLWMYFRLEGQILLNAPNKITVQCQLVLYRG